jgi:hypothetical protein
MVIFKWKLEKEVKKMNAEIILALVIAVPVVLFPAAFVWYLNLGGLLKVIRGFRGRKAGAQASA